MVEMQRTITHAKNNSFLAPTNTSSEKRHVTLNHTTVPVIPVRSHI
jgi:hypothetical protein